MTSRPKKKKILIFLKKNAKANQGGMIGAWLGGKVWQSGLIKKIKLKKKSKGKLCRHDVGMEEAGLKAGRGKAACQKRF